MTNRVPIVVLLVSLCGMLVGCDGGGSGGGELGSVTFTVHWPSFAPAGGQVVAAAVPGDALSVTVALANDAGPVAPAQTVNRPTFGLLTTDVHFWGVPPGPITATATAYPQPNGAGTPLATASVPVDVAAGEAAHETLVLTSTVATMAVAPDPASVAVGGTVQLTATATDDVGEDVLMAPGALQWLPSTGIITVDGNGLVTGVAVGSADVTVTDTESGKLATAHITVTGPGPHTAVTASLAQTGPGAAPMVRLAIVTDPTALAATHGWLIYRAADNSGFPAVAQYLIGLILGQHLNTYSDEPFQDRTVEDQAINFQIIQDGSPVDAGVTASYNDPPLVPGDRYFYAVQRVIDPAGGADVMAHSRQITPAIPSLVANPDNSILSYPSGAAGPVTFFLPPLLSTPAADVNVGDSATFTWQSTTGADEYIVKVFPNAAGSGSPVAQSAVVSVDSAVVDLSALTAGPYWWTVGARQSADPQAPINLATGEHGWLYSVLRAFTRP